MKKELDKKRIAEAAETGYIGKNGKAVSMAVPDVKGSPTGAFTDIGAGRSSVVKPHVRAHPKMVKNHS